MAIWARANEKARRLAPAYACSERHEQPQIGSDAVTWACEFITHQTRRMLFRAHNHVADNPFHAECLKLIRKLREAPGQQLAHSVLLKRMKTDSKSFSMLIETLCQQGELEIVSTPRPGWPVRGYRLIQGETSPGGET